MRKRQNGKSKNGKTTINGKSLKNKRVAMLLCDGFEEEEMTSPRKALLMAGAKVDLISPNPKEVKGWRHTEWGKTFKVNKKLDAANPAKYDALVLPGGVMNPDKLRTYKKAIKFISHFLQKKKPVAAICHGPWTLAETGKLRGRRMTSYQSIKTDLKNAGAIWQNKKVVVDRTLVTSRQPGDLPAFNKAMVMVIKNK